MLRLITSLMGWSIGQDTSLPAKMINPRKTLIPMGAGLVMGLEGRPLFTRPLEVSRHLRRLRMYGEERWAQKQRARQAQKKARRNKAHGAKVQRNPAAATDRRQCPAKGGAKRSAMHYGADFYAKPIAPDGRRHLPFQVVDTGLADASQEPHTRHFTPQHARTRQRRPETHKRRCKTWVCEAHGHPPCRACAIAHRGVRYCCARGHQGHPRVPAMCPRAAGRAPTPLRRLGVRRASQRTPGWGEGGRTPAPKRRVTRTPVRGGGGHSPGASGAQSQSHPRRARTKRRRGETPPQDGPPGKRARRPERHGRAGTEVS